MALPDGVPPLPPGLSSQFQQPALASGDSVSAMVAFGPTTWGIYDQNGNPVVQADNVTAFDYKRNWRIADYQIEQGDFSSYDKVVRPYDAKITFTKGGSVSDRGTFIGNFETIGASLDLYSIVIPEITYLDANIEVFGFHRTSEKGVTLISVEVGLKEIMQTATQSFTNTASPVAADQVNGGNVQPTTTPQATQNAINETFDT